MPGLIESSRRSLRGSFPLLPVLLACFCVSCGYQSVLGPAPRAVNQGSDASVSTNSPAPAPTPIVVLALRNDSPEPWLDRILTDAMRREMSARGGFQLVDDRDAAELLLRGRVRPLEIRSKSFSGFVAALEYELTVELDLELLLPSGQVVRLDPRMLTESDVYLASADIEVTRTNRLETLRRLADLLSSRVADTIELIQRPLSPPPTSAPAALPVSGPVPSGELAGEDAE
ncbi:MAG: LPS assembly lipoprotein LptE [Myxococcota bacterium]